MMDFSNRCRGCLSNDEETLQLLDDPTVLLFEDCVRIQISTGEPNLPKHICSTCYGKCSAWAKFRQQCWETNELLSFRLGHEQLEIIGSTSSIEKEEVPETVEEPSLVRIENAEVAVEDGCSDAVFSPDEEDEQVSSVEVYEIKSGRDIACTQCPMQFRSMERFEAHWRTHQGLKAEVCKICNGEFNNARALRRHMLKHVEGKKFTCQECGKSYKFATSLTLHRKCHQDGPRRFVCDLCGKAFVRAHGLKSHMSCHSTEMPFECGECGKRFKNEIMLRNHVTRVHEGVKRFGCLSCSKKFKTAAELQIHERSHTNLKPFKCTECEKSYKTQSHLAVHFRNAHTSERPYECEFCGLRFGHSKVLKSHRLIHTQEKPWQCQVCKQNFRQQATLKSHVRTRCSAGVPPEQGKDLEDVSSVGEERSGIDIGVIEVIESSQ
ncbi:hypothetical protein quinque_009101 [Culex quinquefasciatus]